MTCVLVTDASKRETLAIVRSLSKKGIAVTVGEDRKLCCSFFSKYIKNKIIYPNPAENPFSFIKSIYELVKRSKYDVIFPVDDQTTILFSKYKDKLSKYTKVPVADYETIMKGRDKAKTIKIAMENGIPCPKTYFVDDIEEIRKDEIEFPVVIKPRESSGARGIAYVNSLEELMREYKKVKKRYGTPLIQEYIPHNGGHYSVCALFNQDSEPRAIFVYKELRQYPITGGPATFSVSVEKTDVLKYAIKLLKAMKWYGVAHLDFLIDSRDKKPKLLEVNPRFWSSLELAILSGVDFPYLLYKMALDGDVETVTKYETGIKLRFLVGDILWLLGTKNKLKALPEFLKFMDGSIGYAIWSLDDPKPIVGFILDNLLCMIKKDRREHILRQ